MIYVLYEHFIDLHGFVPFLRFDEEEGKNHLWHVISLY